LGQLRMLIRARYLVDAVGLNRVTGRPLKIGEIEAKIRDLVGHCRIAIEAERHWSDPYHYELDVSVEPLGDPVEALLTLAEATAEGARSWASAAATARHGVEGSSGAPAPACAARSWRAAHRLGPPAAGRTAARS